MKKHLYTLSLLLAMTTQASAGGGCLLPTGIAVYFDSAGTNISGYQTAFALQPFWLIATGIGPISGWEAEITFSDDSVIVTSRSYSPPIIVNTGVADNHIIGLGGCFDSGAGNHTLVQYDVIWFSQLVDGLICIQGSTPSSFTPSSPGYLSCDAELVAASYRIPGGGYYPEGCSVLNARWPVVATENASWGSLKSGF
jgi:hypothetical protein